MSSFNDDIGVHILSYLDFESAASWIDSKVYDFGIDLNDFWRSAAAHMGMALIGKGEDPMKECRRRLQMERNWKKAQPLFIPAESLGACNLELECDSILLTDQTAEIAVLNPTTGRLSIMSSNSVESLVSSKSKAAIDPLEAPPSPNSVYECLPVVEESEVLLRFPMHGLPTDVMPTFVGVEVKPTPEGPVIIIGRAVHRRPQDHPQWIELRAWATCTPEQVCRFPSGFQAVDIDVTRGRVFVNPILPPPMHWHERMERPTAGRAQIVVYPFSAYNAEHQDLSTPLMQWSCQDAVTDLAVEDLTGDWLVVTTLTGVQVWNVEQQTCLTRRLSDVTNNNWPVRSVHVPKFLSIHSFGFVTMQHASDGQASLMLWKIVNNEIQMLSKVSLQLSRRQTPKIHFNGRRVVIAGQNMSSHLVLSVYLITDGCLCEERTLQYQGGLQVWDHLNLTCNDRFVMVNTKLPSNDPDKSRTQGLWVIDLRQETH